MHLEYLETLHGAIPLFSATPLSSAATPSELLYICSHAASMELYVLPSTSSARVMPDSVMITLLIDLAMHGWLAKWKKNVMVSEAGGPDKQGVARAGQDIA